MVSNALKSPPITMKDILIYLMLKDIEEARKHLTNVSNSGKITY